jgi:hypothetical protein
MVGLLADITAQETIKLELYYAHYRTDPNNKYKLRDDINAYWTELHLQQVRKKVLEILQTRNKLPPKQTYSQVITSQIEGVWPATQRAATQLRLQQPNTWPGNLRHPVLISKIQQWGDFILSNYMYLANKKEVLELGIRFIPPKSTDSGADIRAIADYITRINNANANLLKTCEKGPYFAPLPSWEHRHTVPKGCLELLQKWHEVFSNARGKVAQQMTSKIAADIHRIKMLQANKQRVYGAK